MDIITNLAKYFGMKNATEEELDQRLENELRQREAGAPEPATKTEDAPLELAETEEIKSLNETVSAQAVTIEALQQQLEAIAGRVEALEAQPADQPTSGGRESSGVQEEKPWMKLGVNQKLRRRKSA